MQQPVLKKDLYPKVELAEAEAHAWAFKDKDTFELYPCKFPEVGNNEIRGKVLYTGLCMSDSHTGRSLWGPAQYPSCPGHEVVAQVTHVGSEVTNRKVGDIFGVGPMRDGCGECEYCLKNYNQLCTGMPLFQRDLYATKFGGYCTLIQLNSKYTITIPEGMDLSNIPPLMCAGITTYSPLAAHVTKGQKVAILGIGGLGHLGVQYANKMGCEVTAFTTSAEKVDEIKKLGAHHVVVVDSEFKALAEHSNEYDALLNTLPLSDDKIIDKYLSTVKPLGKLLQVGAPSIDTPMQFSFFTIIGKNLSVIGSLIGSIRESEEMLQFSKDHDVKVIVEDFKFEDFPKALNRLENERPQFRCVVNVKEYAEKHGL